MRRGARAWRRLRVAVLERDRYQCQRPIPPDGRPCGMPATDAGHIIAETLGGQAVLANLRAECVPCNRRDGARLAQLQRKARTP
jgi:5-methylcytosine-specific restriction endonuclease McrA